MSTAVADQLNALLSYNPKTGILVWKHRPASRFKDLRSCNRWNAVYAGKRAGTVDRYGYIAINLNGKLNRAHRIAWFMMTGKWPEGCLDHINGVRSDNRWENLREATRSQNNCNKALRSNNKSGTSGISRHPANGKWRVQICFEGKKHHIGYFYSKQQAIEARKLAEKQHHGEFSALNRVI